MRTHRHALVVALLIALVAVLAVGATTGSAQPQASTRSTLIKGTGLNIATGFFCNVVKGAGVADAATRLLSRPVEGKWGPLLADALVSSVAAECKPLLKKATSVATKLYART